MIYGTGVDIVDIDRFKHMLERFGDRIGKRILTQQEFDQFLRRKRSATFLATRFAAKEAASKALGCGIADGLTFHSIEVFNDDRGKPGLRFHAAAEQLLIARNIVSAHISLSDERRYAVAMVVLESTGK
jgi:holo-[acyl-carrier protein] synthase